MRQIYINTMLGTTRINYDPNDDRDIFIVASSCTVDDVFQEHIECTGIQPEDIDVFDDETKTLIPLGNTYDADSYEEVAEGITRLLGRGLVKKSIGKDGFMIYKPTELALKEIKKNKQ